VSYAEVTVEIGFGSGWRTPLGDVVWTDVTDYVEAQSVANIKRGRGDEFSGVQPAMMTVEFDNTDGRFTPTNAASPYYPDVKASVPIRIRCVFDAVDYYRFTGYVEGWPIAWPDGGATRSTVSLTATTSYPRLALATLKAILTMEQLALAPVALFPLSEQASDVNDALSIAYDVSGHDNVPVVGLSLGTVAGIPTDDDPAASCSSWEADLGAGVTASGNPFVWPATNPDWTGALFNRCANPSFEVDTSWHTASNAVLSTSATVAWTGTKSLRARASAGGDVVVVADYCGNKMAEMTPGVETVAKVRVRAGTTARSVTLEAISVWSGNKIPPGVSYLAGQGSYDEVTVGTVTNDSNAAWTEYAVTFTPTTDHPYFALRLTIAGCAAGEDHYIDGEQAFVGADHTYFDGDTTDCQWTGRVGSSVATTATTSLVTTADAGFSIDMVVAGDTLGISTGFFTLCGLQDINSRKVGVVTTPDAFEFGFVATNDHLGFKYRSTAAVTTVDTGIAGLLDPPVVVRHLAITLTRGATTSVARCYVDGVLSYTSAAFTNIDTNFNEFFVQGSASTGLNSASGLSGGVYGRVGLYDRPLTDAEVATLADAALTGWVDEDTASRWARFAGHANVEYATQGQGLAWSMPLLMSNGRNALEILQTFENAERGLLVEGGDGSLVFQTRSVRPQAEVACSLSAAAQEVDADLAPTYDRFAMVNDATVSSSYDTAVIVGRATDTTSDYDYGPYPDTSALWLSAHDELQGAAELTVLTRKDPHFRVPSVTVDVLNSPDDQTTALLALDVSSLIELTDLPSQAPTATMRFFVEGIEENVGYAQHTITFNLSPAETQFGWVLDSATKSLLDTTTIPI